MTTKTPVTAETEKWLLIRLRFFTKFWLRVRIRVRKKTQNPAGVDSGTPDPVPPLVQRRAQVFCPFRGFLLLAVCSFKHAFQDIEMRCGWLGRLNHMHHNALEPDGGIKPPAQFGTGSCCYFSPSLFGVFFPCDVLRFPWRNTVQGYHSRPMRPIACIAMWQCNTRMNWRFSRNITVSLPRLFYC